ncbi:MAG: hypothetical protein R2865_10650 [Deinococcales bacterium]
MTILSPTGIRELHRGCKTHGAQGESYFTTPPLCAHRSALARNRRAASLADEILVLDIYGSNESPIEGISSALIVK